MRKGDATRQEILRVSESLFCSKGYDATSVQDILDVIHGSKGGFYHHFGSKEDVLKTVCEQRASEAAAEAQRLCTAAQDPMERLNLLLRHMLPFSRSNLPFFSMLLPILDRPESVQVRVGYQDALAAAFSGPLGEAVRNASADGTLCPVAAGITGPLTAVVNAFWLEASMLLLSEVRSRRRPEPAAVLDLLQVYRRSVEALLDAPYGSVVLVSLDAWQAFAEEVAARCR